MKHLSFRTLREHLGTTLLTASAIAVGLAVVAASLTLFMSVIGSGRATALAPTKATVAVRPAIFGGSGSMPESDVNRIVATQGVVEAVRVVEGNTWLVSRSGENKGKVASDWGVASSWTGLGRQTLIEGRAPSGPDDIVLQKPTAEANDLAVGDRVEALSANKQVDEFRVVGIAADTVPGTTTSLESHVYFDTATTQVLTDQLGEVTSVAVITGPGVDPGTVAQTLGAEFGSDFIVETEAARSASEIRSSMTAATTMLGIFLVFAIGVLFVAGYVSANAFSLRASQRKRELAMLRTIGARGSQTRKIVVREALLVGGLAGFLGIAFGIALGYGVIAAIVAFVGPGVFLNGLHITMPYLYIVPGLVGVVTAWFAVRSTGRRVAKLSPVEAFSESDSGADECKIGRIRTAFGVVLLPFGALIALSTAPVFVIGGAMMSFTGLVCVGPALVKSASRPFSAVMGRLFGSSGRLAARNAVRQPRRAASTASAVAIGIMLITMVSVATTTAVANQAESTSTIIKTPIVVYDITSRTDPGLAAAAANAPGVESATPILQAPLDTDLTINGEKELLVGAPLDGFAETFDVTPSAGAGALTATTRGAYVAQDVWNEEMRSLTIARLDVPASDTRPREATVPVVGTFDNAVGATYVVDQITMANLVPEAEAAVAYVEPAPGFPTAEVEKALDASTADMPSVVVATTAEFQASQDISLAPIGAIFGALIGLAVIVAVLGLANTIVLSVAGRRREIAFERIIGATRAKVRREIILETIVLGGFGLLTGIGLGLYFGALLLGGSITLTMTVLAALLGGGLVVVLLIAWCPARRAAAIPPLEAATS